MTVPETPPIDQQSLLPIELPVHCANTVFQKSPVRFERWASLNYLVGPNGSGKTTLFNAVMEAARSKWPNKVKILGTGRLGPLEKSVAPWVGDPATRLFQEDNIDSVYSGLFSGQETAHQAFQLLEKRLDLQIRVLGFLRHVFKKTLHFKPSRKGLLILGGSADGNPYQIVDECHGLKELITILTFLYDDTFSVLGIDEPELHLHPQFQRFLLDEIRSVAGSPDIKGKKLVFLVTHSPILLELRHLSDLASIIVFSQGKSPQRVQFSDLTTEEALKVRQALPSFHAGQRELLFCSTPIVVEGATDSTVLLNVATKLDLPLGAAGLGIAPMGGKYQLLAYRALLGSLAKPNARYIVDLDAAVTPNVLHCLDTDVRVVEHLANAGSGERTLSKVSGELIGLLKEFCTSSHKAGKGVERIKLEQDGTLPDAELGVALQQIIETLRKSPEKLANINSARTIDGKFSLIRTAARAANVLILSRGPIEAYYESPIEARNSDFTKQQAFQRELDAIWATSDGAVLESRYSEMLQFIRDAGFLSVPIADMAREPLANLIHLLQTEIRTGRINSVSDAKVCARAVAEGYWFICELEDLQVTSRLAFRGAVRMKSWLGGELIDFDNNTRAYELTMQGIDSST